MSRFKRLSIDEAKEEFPLLNEKARRALKGGCASCDANPGVFVYSMDEYERMDADGSWTGGLVCGLGFVLGEVTVTEKDPYCLIHKTLMENEKCMTCYSEGFDFCRQHESYFPRLNQCYWCAESNTNYGYFTYNPDETPVTPPDKDPTVTPPPTDDKPTVTPPNPDNSKDLYDGIDLKNSKYISLELGGKETFKNQLETILESNSVLKNLLSRFEKGFEKLTFAIGKPDAYAQMAYSNENSLFHITFNEAYISDTGWNGKLINDNVGYDWSKVKTYDEALVVTVVHEAIHANHYARFKESTNIGRTEDAGAQYLLDKGYSEEYVNIFYTKDEKGEWKYEKSVEVVENNMDNYIRNNDHGVIDAALNEYRQEH